MSTPASNYTTFFNGPNTLSLRENVSPEEYQNLHQYVLKKIMQDKDYLSFAEEAGLTREVASKVIPMISTTSGFTIIHENKPYYLKLNANLRKKIHKMFKFKPPKEPEQPKPPEAPSARDSLNAKVEKAHLPNSRAPSEDISGNDTGGRPGPEGTTSHDPSLAKTPTSVLDPGLAARLKQGAHEPKTFLDNVEKKKGRSRERSRTKRKDIDDLKGYKRRTRKLQQALKD
ncbi:MAG: hypothetical protein K940chlam1_01156 [Candidatus Anoxychlamydiales bacterium]|nr:hypothetical protein [Candidatus Anoxychlamydiales bacterium]NGX36133.1 hypothetical protein [Candidatus Anoxychlamydiales bacterium]